MQAAHGMASLIGMLIVVSRVCRDVDNHVSVSDNRETTLILIFYFAHSAIELEINLLLSQSVYRE